MNRTITIPILTTSQNLRMVSPPLINSQPACAASIFSGNCCHHSLREDSCMKIGDAPVGQDSTDPPV
jgi:hypothetical protein